MKEKTKIKVYHVTGANHYSNWLDCKIVKNIKNADLVIFSGGADINPEIYNETKHPFTSINKSRDIKEIEIYQLAQNLNIPCIGICRGSQLITSLNGGKLVQHCTNHNTGRHFIDIKNEVFEITSTHHQMMYPYNLPKEGYKIIGYSTFNRSKEYWKNDKEQYDFEKLVEPEIVYYPKTNSLCIQGHPETMEYCKLHDKLKELINELLFTHKE